MLYPENFEQKIGFEQIRTLIREKCQSALGKRNIDAIGFSSDFEQILKSLSQIDEFQHILTDEEEAFPLNAIFDLEATLHRIRVEGTFMSEKECLELKASLCAVQQITRYMQQRAERYFYLNQLSADVVPLPEITQRIDALFNKFGELKDTASERLATIRREFRKAQSIASHSLMSILNHAKANGYVEKDINPTLREGRLVIPIPPMFKHKIKGIVHDESATGKTIFVEPTAVVEANNRIRELESEERREIIAILTQLTNFIRPFIPDVFATQHYLGAIDAINAKAQFALSINAIKPHFTNESCIEWNDARHPLLHLSLKAQGKSVVPLRIKLNEHQRILIISGPNAGGKSVCLKTVALLQYMLQCGLLIPIHESSVSGIFDRIFIDIGDEQSIENDLSTYSSHLLNMKFFMRNATSKTLLLIDEFGTGTEPQIGGAIAEAVLNQLNRQKTMGVITTHYTNLKDFATRNEGVVNGAMLYDRHRMCPLFQLQIGNPGSSFAIEIARKIGLPESVIAEATDKVGTDFVDLDKYLQDIVRDKRYWESKRLQIKQKEKQTEQLIARYESELAELNQKQKSILREAKINAEHLLAEANAQIENTIRKIKESQAEREVTREARAELDEFRKKQKEQKTPTALEQKLKKLPKQKTVHAKKADAALQVGDCVTMKSNTNAIGTILELKNNVATVAFGNIKSKIKLENLEKSSRAQLRNATRQQSIVTVSDNNLRNRKLQFKPEIDIRGMRADEAQQAIMYFIDDAMMVGIANVRILHGTGNGVLRQLTRDYLSGFKNLHFHDEHVQFGGAGITVVEF